MNDNDSGKSLLYRILVITGGTALLAAMAIDVVAVIGRATGIPLLGSIEMVQVVVGIAGAVGMLVATLHHRHARVLILFNRLRGGNADRAGRFNALMGALFFTALAAGSLWLLSDLWYGDEESELWHIPYKPLRLFICMTLAAVTAVFLRQVRRGDRS